MPLRTFFLTRKGVKLIMDPILTKAAKIRLLICDVDGVLTDGGLFFGDDGQEYKAFNSKDGHGMKMLQNSGVDIAIITGRTSNVVTLRMKNLGIEHLYQGQHDKRHAFQELLETFQLSAEEVAYVGDDVVDLPVMSKVGLAITVADGHEFVKQHAHWCTQNSGGKGAVREVCELLMKAQGKYEDEMASYLR